MGIDLQGEKMKLKLLVNGMEYDVIYNDYEVKNIFIPLLKELTIRSKKKNGKFIVFLAAPPGTGKSTLSLFLEKLSKEDSKLESIQALSLDGFHYTNNYLKTTFFKDKNSRKISLYERKGSPETFDIETFKIYIKKIKEERDVKWPIYDRKLHNPVMNVDDIKSKILLIEGNWLLLNEEKWKEVGRECDYSIFIEADSKLLKERLISRKKNGGLTEQEAEEFYLKSDFLNIERVIKKRKKCDLTLEMLETGEYKIKEDEYR